MASVGPFRAECHGDYRVQDEEIAGGALSICTAGCSIVVATNDGRIMAGDVDESDSIGFDLLLIGGDLVSVEHAEVASASLAGNYSRFDRGEAARRQRLFGCLNSGEPWPKEPKPVHDRTSLNLNAALDRYLEKLGVRPSPFQLRRREQAKKAGLRAARAARPEHVSESPEDADSGDL